MEEAINNEAALAGARNAIPMAVGITNNTFIEEHKMFDNNAMTIEQKKNPVLKPITVYSTPPAIANNQVKMEHATAGCTPQSDLLVPMHDKNQTKEGAIEKKKTKMIFNGQARELIMRLRTYFERENENGGPLLPVQQVVERVSDALGVSRKTIARIKTQKFGKDRKEDNNLLDWKPTKVVPKRVSGADEVKAGIIRNHIYEYYRKMELPSLSKLVKSLSELDVYKGGESSLRRLLKSIGFEYVFIPKRKKILMEETNQAFKKCSIPKEAIDVRQWKNVMVLEESSFGREGSTKSPWENIPKEKLIICHAVNTTCLPKYCLAFPIHDMDASKFRDWYMKLLYPYP